MSFIQDLTFKKARGIKSFGLLIDPDKYTGILDFLSLPEFEYSVDYLLIGGSLLTGTNMQACIEAVRSKTDKKLIIFPGNQMQIHTGADAFLLLSLISGRNPEFLIGRHVESAAMLKASGLEILPTGYILVDGGRPTTASYISNTSSIPYDKPDIASCTAMAGEMLGMKLIYLDAGSGALRPISNEFISKVSKSVGLPLITGGGIRTIEKIKDNWNAGADLVILGDVFERDVKQGIKIISDLASMKDKAEQSF
jgi:putative glycerol-1-phosphate prenyltransferase